MKLRIFSKTIISTGTDLSCICNSVSNDCGILGFGLDYVCCYSELLNYWMWEAIEKAHNFLKRDTLFVMEMQIIIIQTIIAWHGLQEVVHICNFIIFITC